MIKLFQLFILLPATFTAISCSQPPDKVTVAQPQVAGPTTQPTSDPKRTLTLAWNRETYQVPEPAVISPAMRQSETFQQWWNIGDIRTLEFTDDAGRRVTADMMGRGRDETGVLKALIMYSYRYRIDGTLEVKTANTSDGPAEWTVYAADGKTPTVQVVNRQNGTEGTPFIQYVYFLGPDGKKERGYQANRHGVVYIEWFYNENESPDHWNGSSKLDGPLAAGS